MPLLTRFPFPSCFFLIFSACRDFVDFYFILYSIDMPCSCSRTWCCIRIQAINSRRHFEQSRLHSRCGAAFVVVVGLLIDSYRLAWFMRCCQQQQQQHRVDNTHTYTPTQRVCKYNFSAMQIKWQIAKRARGANLKRERRKKQKKKK